MSKICEICNQREVDDLINVGLDVGYHIGDYGKGEYEEYKVKPTCIKVVAIYVCYNCKSKIKKNKYFNIDVMDELTDVLKTAIIKQMIIEGLR